MNLDPLAQSWLDTVSSRSAVTYRSALVQIFKWLQKDLANVGTLTLDDILKVNAKDDWGKFGSASTSRTFKVAFKSFLRFGFSNQVFPKAFVDAIYISPANLLLQQSIPLTVTDVDFSLWNSLEVLDWLLIHLVTREFPLHSISRLRLSDIRLQSPNQIEVEVPDCSTCLISDSTRYRQLTCFLSKSAGTFVFNSAIEGAGALDEPPPYLQIFTRLDQALKSAGSYRASHFTPAPRYYRQPLEIISDDVIEQVIESQDSPQLKIIFLLTVYHHLSTLEVVNLQWNDWYPHEEMLKYTYLKETKIVYPLHPKLLVLLSHFNTHSSHQYPQILINERGRPHTLGSVYKQLLTAFHRHNIPYTIGQVVPRARWRAG